MEVDKHKISRQFREKELELRAGEVANQRSLRYMNLLVATVAGLAVLGGAALTAAKSYELEKFKAESSVKLEQQKYGWALMMKAADSKDSVEIATRLKAWVNVGIVPESLRQEWELKIYQDPSSFLPPAESPSKFPGEIEKSAEEVAVEQFRRRVDANGRDTDALIYLGFALYKLGKADEAIIYLKRATEINKKSTWGYYNLALAHYLANNVREGDAAIKLLLNIDQGFRLIMKRHNQFDKYAEQSEYLKSVLR